MSSKLKLGMGVAGLVLLIGGAVIAYNTLTKQAEAENAVMAENAEAAETQRHKAPDFSMIDQDGNSVALSDIIARGKPVVLNFWASWCPPCKSEMPEFDKVHKELGGEIQFMMVDLTDGQRETVEKGTRYITEQGFSFPVYFDTKGEGSYTYGIRSIPTTLFIDKDGYMVTGVQGAINEATLRKGIGYLQ